VVRKRSSIGEWPLVGRAEELALLRQLSSTGLGTSAFINLNATLERAGVPTATSQAIVDANASSRNQRAAGRSGRVGAHRAGPDAPPADAPRGE
jgi:hypothetical protein